MNLIDPFEFRDMFAHVRSVAIVGNAPCVLNHRHGALIDSHDLVVRFNRARTGGLEEAIGSRTDVLFVNAANSRTKAEPPDQLSRPRCLVCLCSPQGTRTAEVAPFRAWVGDCPILMSFGPDLIGLPPMQRSMPLTSGTYALFILLRLFALERLFVSGFTMFGAVAGGTGKYWDEAAPAAAAAHDLDQEASLFAFMLKSFPGKLTVTEEVSALARRAGVELQGLSNGAQAWAPRAFYRRVADGLAWRFLSAGMYLRRIAGSE